MEIKKLDKENMRKTILDFPRQFKIGFEAAKNIKIAGEFNKIIICGMGGSALPGDILGMWLRTYRIELPLTINRSYYFLEGKLFGYKWQSKWQDVGTFERWEQAIKNWNKN